MAFGVARTEQGLVCGHLELQVIGTQIGADMMCRILCLLVDGLHFRNDESSRLLLDETTRLCIMIDGRIT